MNEIPAWISARGDRVTVDSGQMGGRFEVRVIQSGEIEIYTPDGHLEIEARGGDNVIRLRCVPTWDDSTATKIAANIISESSPRAAAETIVALLRGRINKNRPHS